MKTELTIWDRLFDLDVIFQCYDNEEIIPEQEEALKLMLQADQEINSAKDAIEKYTKENYPEFEIKPNIFTYVVPKNIFVAHSKNKKAAIICNYKPDMEHGLAIVFEDGKFKEIGEEGIIY